MQKINAINWVKFELSFPRVIDPANTMYNTYVYRTKTLSSIFTMQKNVNTFRHETKC